MPAQAVNWVGKGLGPGRAHARPWYRCGPERVSGLGHRAGWDLDTMEARFGERGWRAHAPTQSAKGIAKLALFIISNY